MVNPSTDDADNDDATIRKLRGFGEHNGWGRLLVGNLFAYRATDVRALGRAVDPIGPDNDGHIADIIDECDRLIAAWGPVSKQPALLRGRWAFIWLRNKPMFSIGHPAKCGHPKHPLMLPYDSPILPWSGP